MDNKNNNRQYDKKMLKEYLNKFSKKQLMEYFDLVAQYSFECEMFMKVSSLWLMLYEINFNVRRVDPSFPYEMGVSDGEFLSNNPLYFFDYLGKDVIVDILYSYIDNHVIMAENTAETLYNCGREAAMQYPNMVLSIQKQLGPKFEVLM